MQYCKIAGNSYKLLSTPSSQCLWWGGTQHLAGWGANVAGCSRTAALPRHPTCLPTHTANPCWQQAGPALPTTTAPSTNTLSYPPRITPWMFSTVQWNGGTPTPDQMDKHCTEILLAHPFFKFIFGLWWITVVISKDKIPCKHAWCPTQWQKSMPRRFHQWLLIFGINCIFLVNKESSCFLLWSFCTENSTNCWCFLKHTAVVVPHTMNYTLNITAFSNRGLAFQHAATRKWM